MAEVAPELLEKANALLESARRVYPKSVAGGITGPKAQYKFRVFIRDLGRTANGSVRCVNQLCQSEVFVGWPPRGLREEFDAIAKTYPNCQALHERLIENGSVVACRETVDTAFNKLIDLVKSVTARAEEIRRGL